MIPILEDIIRALCAGTMSAEEALGYLARHEEMNAERRAEDRKYFAGLAMQGLAANAHGSLASWGGQQTAECAVKFADALLAELAK